MRELTILEMDEISCGSSYSVGYSGGYETGKLVAKTALVVSALVTTFAAFLDDFS